MTVANGNPADSLQSKKEALLNEVKQAETTKIKRQRVINQGWSIALSVAAITSTLLATVLGVVDVGGWNGFVKFLIALFGAAAVASQTAERQFRTKGKAREYAVHEADMTVLIYRIAEAKDESEIDKLRQDFYQLLKDIAQTEATGNDDDGNEVAKPRLPGRPKISGSAE